MSDGEDEVYTGRSSRLRDKKSMKVLPPRAAKLSFKYESQDLENAVSAVLCGMSIKEAAASYKISKNMLKQALSEEIDMEPQEDGSVLNEEKSEDDISQVDSKDSISTRVAECQAAYDSQKSENMKRKVADAMVDGMFGDEVDVTCGFCSGVLYRRKFFCPGLHCECILTDGQWVTPKQFSIMGGKASLKNWKNAIRINNVNLRFFMEQGSLDFWDHQINCSGKCYHKTSGGPGKYQSKINCLERKTLGNIETLHETLTPSNNNSPDPINGMILEENMSEDIPSFVPMVQSVANSQAFSVLRRAQGSDEFQLEDNQPVFPAPVIKTETPDNGEYGSVKSGATMVVESPVLNISPLTSNDVGPSQSLLLRNQVIHAQKQKALGLTQPAAGATRQASVDLNAASGLPTVRYLIQNGIIKGQVKQVGEHQFVLQNNVTDHPPEILQVASSFPDIESIMKDSKKFWQGIHNIGILAEIFNEIKAKMRSIKHEMLNVAITAENADKMSRMVNTLGLQTKVKYKLANHKVAAEAQNRRIQEEINELQKKMEDSQKKQAELKRKSHCFEELLQKRPRLEKRTSRSDDGAENQRTLGTITKTETVVDADENKGETTTSERNVQSKDRVPEKTSSEMNGGEDTDGDRVNVINTESGEGVSVKMHDSGDSDDDDCSVDSEESADEKSS